MIKVKIYSSQTLAEQEQAPHVGRPARLRDTNRLSGMRAAQFRARATGLTIRSSRARFAVSARLETSGQRAGLTQALGITHEFVAKAAPHAATSKTPPLEQAWRDVIDGNDYAPR